MSRFYRRELLFGNETDDSITPHKIHLFLDLANPFSGKTDEEILRRYRFPPGVILEITNLLKEDLERPTRRSRALPALYQVIIGLRYMATNSFQIVIGDTVRISQVAACNALHRFMRALVKHINRFVRFPTAENIDQIKENFHQVADFPNVVGLVDGTHVKMVPPAAEKGSFKNLKGFHSINVQCVCDHDGTIVHIYANWGGSRHDGLVFKESNVPTLMNSLPSPSWLLGDSGYACSSTLLTPFDECANQSQRKYNDSHRKTRVLIEQMYGRWKRRFSILHSAIRLKTPQACSLAIVCCGILHNMAMAHNLSDVDFGEYIENDNVPERREAATVAGARFRYLVAQQFFH